MPAFRRLTIPVDVAKIFALIAMTADHAPKVLALPGIINDTLGRMAFPLFAFLIIQNYCRRIDLQGPFAGRQPLDPMVGILCVLSLAFSHFICHPHMVWRLAKTRKEKNHDIQNSCIRDNGPVPDGLWQ